jgi:hypothetical protein
MRGSSGPTEVWTRAVQLKSQRDTGEYSTVSLGMSELFFHTEIKIEIARR